MTTTATGFPVPLPGAHADTLMWAHPHDVEPAALEQLRNISRLPWVHGLRVMPDVHLGKGATVGSVVAMRDAVSPSAVGVDIGCFTGDTEILLADSRTYSLKSLAEKGGEFVVYACTASGLIQGATATARKTRRNAALVEVTLDNGERIRCTPDHEFMLRDGTYRRADALTPETSLMPMYGKLDPEGYFRVQQPHNGRWQRAHWIMGRSGLLGEVPSFPGDRTVIHHKNFDEADNRPENLEFMSSSAHSRYHRSLVERNTTWQNDAFEEARKKALADKANTPEGYAFYAERGTKNIVKYMSERREHFLAAVAGNGQRGKEYLVAYNTSEKGRAKSREMANASYPCPECGVRIKSWIGVFNHRRKEHGVVANHTVVSVRPLDESEDVYCLTVPEHGNFALGGEVFVHNCGMTAVKTDLTWADLPDDLGPLRAAIEQAIPVGFNAHDGTAPVLRRDQRLRSRFDRLMGGFADLRARSLGDREGRAFSQCGTLGSGNHFIEVTVDDDETVWLMLHSGSRNIGKEIAERHIAGAKGLEHNLDLPDRDLAVFLAGTPGMSDYLHDLYWAQDYAALNRQVMMATLKGVVADHLGRQVDWGTDISCHHNYVAEERLSDGTELIVTRKGAISAKGGQYGLIPGSMGTGSYVVKGRGNEASYWSASHGAGRKMSRSKAKKVFTVDDLADQTAGVECRKDAGVVDEIPGAYKDLTQVIAAQADLVEVEARLTTLLCVKG